MQSEFSAETHEQITSLCKRISVAHHLNDEIEAELRDHIIDKMESYLSGEEVLSEDDAFVLVKEHFGNPEVIRSLYESAEPAAAFGGILRRVEAATVATILCFILGSYVSELLFSLLANLTPQMWVPETYIFAIPKTISHIIGITFFGIVLSYWREKMKRGEQLWFYSIKQYWFLGLIVSSVLLMLGIIYATDMRHLPYNLFSVYTLLASIMFHCILWVKWIDNDSERIRSIIAGFVSWIITQYFIIDVIHRVIIWNYPINPTVRGYTPTHPTFINPLSMQELYLPCIAAFFFYTLFFCVHKVKMKLIGSLA